MTDRTPQNKAETPATLAGTTYTARDSELKSRALPQADALKERFKAGSIPLQTDFADLIDLANMGRQAVGRAKGQTGPANGFTLSATGLLELKTNTAKGIKVDSDGVFLPLGYGLRHGGDGLDVLPKSNGGLAASKEGVWVIPGQGITVDSAGVGVKAGKSIKVDSDGVDLKLKNDTKLYSDSAPLEWREGDKFLGVNMGDGIEFRSNGIGVIAGNGIAVTSANVSVKARNGIAVDSSGVSIKLAANSGLSADETNGLKIVPEQMFQKGMVIMFAGTEAEMPKGWALCDGNGGRPDLRDRFVLGSTGFTNVNQTNGKKVTGTNVDKQYMVSSDAKTPSVSVTVNNHTLTISQIPSHSHYGGVRYNYDSGSYDIMNLNEYGLYDLGRKGSSGNSRYAKLQNYSDSTSITLKLVKSSYTGSSGGHSHTASATQSPHQHNTNVVPPYYILAFIIKV